MAEPYKMKTRDEIVGMVLAAKPCTHGLIFAYKNEYDEAGNYLGSIPHKCEKCIKEAEAELNKKAWWKFWLNHIH